MAIKINTTTRLENVRIQYKTEHCLRWDVVEVDNEEYDGAEKKVEIKETYLTERKPLMPSIDYDVVVRMEIIEDEN